MHRINLVLTLLIGCGGSSPEPAKPATQPAQPSADIVPMCKKIFARKATCADDYLPLLVDLRVELNQPPGLADKIKADGRDAVIAIAHTELAHDTAPDQIAALCETAAAKAAKAPPAMVSKLLEQAATCDAAADCKAFAPCAVALDRGFMTGANQP